MFKKVIKNLSTAAQMFFMLFQKVKMIRRVLNLYHKLIITTCILFISQTLFFSALSGSWLIQGRMSCTEAVIISPVICSQSLMTELLYLQPFTEKFMILLRPLVCSLLSVINTFICLLVITL